MNVQTGYLSLYLSLYLSTCGLLVTSYRTKQYSDSQRCVM